MRIASSLPEPRKTARWHVSVWARLRETRLEVVMTTTQILATIAKMAPNGSHIKGCMTGKYASKNETTVTESQLVQFHQLTQPTNGCTTSSDLHVATCFLHYHSFIHLSYLARSLFELSCALLLFLSALTSFWFRHVHILGIIN